MLAKSICDEYAERNPLFICVLNGAAPFAVDLFRACEDIDAEPDFRKAEKLRWDGVDRRGQTGDGSERESCRPTYNPFVEDIIDTGNTMVKLLADLEAHNPASLRLQRFCLSRRRFNIPN